MHTDYKDIRERIDEEPKWYDEHAVPRYCEFHPQEISNIYADKCCLFLIQCQACSQLFAVCLSQGHYDRGDMAEAIAGRELHFGDPPNIGCCNTGDCMNSVPLRTLEFWERQNGDWARVWEMEGRILLPDWAKPEEDYDTEYDPNIPWP